MSAVSATPGKLDGFALQDAQLPPKRILVAAPRTPPPGQAAEAAGRSSDGKLLPCDGKATAAVAAGACCSGCSTPHTVAQVYIMHTCNSLLSSCYSKCCCSQQWATFSSQRKSGTVPSVHVEVAAATNTYRCTPGPLQQLSRNLSGRCWRPAATAAVPRLLLKPWLPLPPCSSAPSCSARPSWAPAVGCIEGLLPGVPSEHSSSVGGVE